MRGERELYRDKIEVSLDGKQVFTLFFGGAVIASLVFVLGITVGRRLESRAHADTISAREAAITDPLAALDLLAAAGDPDGAGSVDDLSFPRALAAPEPAPEPDAEPAAEPAPEPEPDEPSDAEARAAAEKKGAEEKKAAEAKVAAERKAAEEKAAAEKKAEAERKKARFTLQLSSFQDESEATTFYQKLRASGYEPFITRAEVPEKGTWFRVRLGKYASYDDAIAAKQSFEKAEKIIAYVTPL
jgi:cell division septation protein DedD